jgi:hypothetical protein
MGMMQVVATGGGCNEKRYGMGCHDGMTKIIIMPNVMTIYLAVVSRR